MRGSCSGRRAGPPAGAAAAALLIAVLATGCAGPVPDDGAAATPGTTTAAAASSEAPAVASVPAPTPAEASAPARADGETAAAPSPRPRVLAASAPVSLRIPVTGTESQLLHLGLRENGSLEVPPEPPGSPAGWYDGSPTPGERGPAVLLGHVNATGGGPGVFAGLRSLSPGDRIEVARQDGSAAVFVVGRGEQYAKDAFPTLEVYGDTAGSELRLITCDGYDPATGLFDDNYVVYASLDA